MHTPEHLERTVQEQYEQLAPKFRSIRSNPYAFIGKEIGDFSILSPLVKEQPSPDESPHIMGEFKVPFLAVRKNEKGSPTAHLHLVKILAPNPDPPEPDNPASPDNRPVLWQLLTRYHGRLENFISFMDKVFVEKFSHENIQSVRFPYDFGLGVYYTLEEPAYADLSRFTQGKRFDFDQNSGTFRILPIQESQGWLARSLRKRSMERQLIDAVAFCHSNGIAHADIKPDNVFIYKINKGYRLKLADFDVMIDQHSIDQVLIRESALTSTTIQSPPQAIINTTSATTLTPATA